MSTPKPISDYMRDNHFPVDPRSILLIVFAQTETEICVVMPEAVVRLMTDTLRVDILAAVKDYLENLPNKGKPV